MQNNKDNFQLYFVAIVPGEPLRSEITKLKEWMYEEFATKAALRSPPHITLHMPFKWKPGKEEVLKESLASLAPQLHTFEVKIKNFSCFEPRVIYIDVVENESLSHVKEEVMEVSRKVWKLQVPRDMRGFHPHITIGFRDLKKPQFFKAWDQLKERTFHASFEAEKITLLKHNGKHWDEHLTFELTGKK